MDAILFDVDGTLWDSRQVVADSWNAALQAEKGYDPGYTPEDMTPLFGKTMTAIADCLFPDLPEEERYSLMHTCIRYEDEWLEHRSGEFYPGVRETLPLLAERYPLYVVSNCQSGYIEQMLRYSGVETCFSGWVCFGDNGLSKGENIKLLMERNGLKDPVYVGDTQGDWEACQQADIPMIFAAYGLGQVKDELPTIHSFAELNDLV